MKLRTAFAVALSLAAAHTITQSAANAGILFTIRFGGFHRHHVVHHQSNLRRVARKSSTQGKRVQTVGPGGPTGPLTMATPGGDVTIQGLKGKEILGPVVVRRPGATKDTASQIVPMYYSLAEPFRGAAGPVTFFLSGTIGELRKFTQVYDAPDNIAGHAFIAQQGEAKGRCIVSLVENVHQSVDDLKFTMAHELTHCIDMRLGTTTRTDFLEAFFADVNKNTRAAIVAHGFEHYIEPEEALAEAVAYYIVPAPSSSYRVKAREQWDIDFANVNAKVYEMLTSIKVNVSARSPQAAMSPGASVNIRPTACLQSDRTAYDKCMGGL
jgi:hypothetical protein